MWQEEPCEGGAGTGYAVITMSSENPYQPKHKTYKFKGVFSDLNIICL